MLAQTRSTGIITVNYGYARYGTGPDPVAAAAHLAADWVRYDNGRTKFWEIGNETYGNWEAGYQIDQSQNHDGQPAIITGALYGTHVKVFADSIRAAAKETGATVYVGATLYQQAASSSDNATVQNWNQGVLANAGATADYFIVHDYFTAYATNSALADVLSTGKSVPSSVMSYIQQQMKGAGLPVKPVAMTEWNIQATGSKQNVSYIAGMHAALTLGSAHPESVRRSKPLGPCQRVFRRRRSGDVQYRGMSQPLRYGIPGRPFTTCTISRNISVTGWLPIRCEGRSAILTW